MIIFPLLLSVSCMSPCWVISLTRFRGNLNKTPISLRAVVGVKGGFVTLKSSTHNQAKNHLAVSWQS